MRRCHFRCHVTTGLYPPITGTNMDVKGYGCSLPTGGARLGHVHISMQMVMDWGKFKHRTCKIEKIPNRANTILKLGKIALSLNYNSFLHIQDNYIWIRCIGCGYQGASIHIWIIYIYIKGVEKGESVLKSQDTFSVILLIHPFYYLPGLLELTRSECKSNTTCSSHDINGCKFSLKFLWSP